MPPNCGGLSGERSGGGRAPLRPWTRKRPLYVQCIPKRATHQRPGYNRDKFAPARLTSFCYARLSCRGGAMGRRLFVACLLLPLAATAQIHTTRQKYADPAKPRSAMAHSPKQMDCKAITQSDPRMLQFCEQIDYDLGVGYSARAFGAPRPSLEVVPLPAHGSVEAKRFGVSCMGQLAMRRLENGWEQLRDKDGNYLRCRDL